jgi:hypothetical protein
MASGNHTYNGICADFPVAPAWPDQDGAGAHANVSGAGVVKSSDPDTGEYRRYTEAEAESIERQLRALT